MAEHEREHEHGYLEQDADPRRLLLHRPRSRDRSNMRRRRQGNPRRRRHSHAFQSSSPGLSPTIRWPRFPLDACAARSTPPLRPLRTGDGLGRTERARRGGGDGRSWMRFLLVQRTGFGTWLWASKMWRTNGLGGKRYRYRAWGPFSSI